MDFLEQTLMGTGHRRRPFVRVIAAIVDLLIYQDSEHEAVRVQTRALLSLVLRETSDIRRMANEAAKARGKRARPDDEIALERAADFLGVPRKKLDGAFDRIDYATARRWIGKLRRTRQERRKVGMAGRLAKKRLSNPDRDVTLRARRMPNAPSHQQPGEGVQREVLPDEV